MVFFRLYRWRRQSGQTVRQALARAWAKWREPDPFEPLSKRKS